MGIMLVAVAIALALAVALVVGWYLWFAHANRRQSVQVLGWIEQALAGHGQVAGVEWINPSRFRVTLHMALSGFHSPSLMVRMAPREKPWNWLVSWVRRQEPTLTFESDLDLPPTFSLELRNHRWYARTRKKLSLNDPNWVFDRGAPFVMTTRMDWQRDVTNMFDALADSRQHEFLRIAFRRTSPHFSATLPLEAISPASVPCSDMFEVIRELAGHGLKSGL